MGAGELTGLVALLIPILPVSVVSLWLFGKTELGRAVAHRLAHGPAAAGTATDEDVAELRQQVDDLRLGMSDMQERLDFAERMLARGRETERLPGVDQGAR
jgi:hypothetical protein